MKSTAKIKSTMTMLEYCKLLLNKISFNDELLKKEYQKGLKYLNPKDQEELKQWLLLKGKMVDNKND
ncbi:MULTISPECIES: hypothetical protein [Ekhidna]|jgi:hypothetical protein|uniref:Uncharacterized protein n=1 Tax=Ekhidna lutea TaxID=447679 RepID=A0A239LD77_EKHLU|nr:hypothetical protein [Ekhidna lutea]SNT27589.1 hypothetical protein SAMN05421640_3113 [Ekhidna lutea]